VETLRLRLTAQQATNRSLAEASDKLIANVEAMRQEDIESDARAAKTRRKTKSKTKFKVDPKGGESSSSRPEPVGQATECRDQERKLRKKLRKIHKETKVGPPVILSRERQPVGHERGKLVLWDSFLFILRLRRIPGFPVFPVVEIKLRIFGHVIGRRVSTTPPGPVQESPQLQEVVGESRSAKGHSTLQQSLQVPIGNSYLLPDPT